MITIGLGVLSSLLAYKVYVNKKKAQQWYKEFDRLNRLVKDLKGELWQKRIDLQTATNEINLAKMSHEKTKQELEDKARTWENQLNNLKNESKGRE